MDAPELVVLEATGGYEQPMAEWLAEAGIPFHLANSVRVRSYARALGFHVKTNVTDAYIIALLQPGHGEEP